MNKPSPFTWLSGARERGTTSRWTPIVPMKRCYLPFQGARSRGDKLLLLSRFLGAGGTVPGHRVIIRLPSTKKRGRPRRIILSEGAMPRVP